jgi:predicted RNase H-like HicB family nuclease
MCARSKESAKAIDRPFRPEVLKQAQRIAEQYQVILSCEEGHWYGRGLEMPNVFGDGKTVNQCLKDTREALCGAVALMLEQGQRPSAPARIGTRTAQINVRLTAEEKALLESTAKRKGYSGLSDFIRAAAIESAK